MTYSSFQGLEIRDPDSLEVLRSVPAESTTTSLRPRPRHQRRRLGDRGKNAATARLYDFESLRPIGDAYPHERFDDPPARGDIRPRRRLVGALVGDQVVVVDVDPDMWESNACCWRVAT